MDTQRNLLTNGTPLKSNMKAKVLHDYSADTIKSKKQAHFNEKQEMNE